MRCRHVTLDAPCLYVKTTALLCHAQCCHLCLAPGRSCESNHYLRQHQYCLHHPKWSALCEWAIQRTSDSCSTLRILYIPTKSTLVATITATQHTIGHVLSQGNRWTDRVLNLPGLTFAPGFEHYSGYFDVPSGNKLHYWFFESQHNPSTDPLMLWLNGGPGCSSLGGLFTELGPFRVNPDGKTLFENVYSWNKGANVLFLEAPRDVGFSYGKRSDMTYSDTKTAIDNADAIELFMDRFPEYNQTRFYVTGESYGGVYVPTLTRELITRIQSNKLNTVNLAGFAVGNGLLSYKQQVNSVIDVMYNRGIYGKQEFEALVNCCRVTPQQQPSPLAYCDFAKYIHFESGLGPVPNNGSTLENACAKLVIELGDKRVWDTINDVYNTYQDCYMDTNRPGSSKALRLSRFIKRVGIQTRVKPESYQFVDQGSKFNMGSTDAQDGFPCWMDAATEHYLNIPAVRTALHIPLTVSRWTDCSDTVSEHYQWEHFDTTPVFQQMIDSKYPLRILVYNGDMDTVCNFLGDEWFVEQLAASNAFSHTTRVDWQFSDGLMFDKVTVGYCKQFQLNTTPAAHIQLDLLTVKGAGHFVPLDRGGPALQMIDNFMHNRNYSHAVSYNTQAKPLLLQYQPQSEPQLSRKQADRVWNLPGLTFVPTFKQYSGYLNPSPGNYLHYWLLESQNNPSTAPLVLWLNGGPGCSSLMGLLTELGPFWPNPHGNTLSENIYSWNKIGNMLFMESPRQVGYSYQNLTENNSTQFNDLMTAQDNFLALIDFLRVFPEYYNRPLYVTGESYAGVYIPTLVSLLIDMIQTDKAPGVNLVGVAIGNGKMTDKYQFNSIISLLYNRGVYGTEVMNQLAKCCPTTKPLRDCDFSAWVGFDRYGDAHPINASQCAHMTAYYGRDAIWRYGAMQDTYNMFQDCYWDKEAAQRTSALLTQSLRRNTLPDFINQNNKINFESTDSQGAFQCYNSLQGENYLNSDDVRTALHISPLAGIFSICSDPVGENYTKQNSDTSPVFDHIVQSGYKLRMLIYNGDLDTSCNYVGDEWFSEALVARHSMQLTVPRQPWHLEENIAGYYKRFMYAQSLELDVLTVKGAGHMVPSDRPGPALQMITNFITHLNYSSPLVSMQRTPLKPQYITQLKLSKSVPMMRSQVNRLMAHEEASVPSIHSSLTAPPPGSKQADEIVALPGLTFPITFKHYSGYLSASEGNYLHYWLVESQKQPGTAPLILWLNGGPGCSSMGGLLTELGPFRPNPDGATLYENPFAWNKFANVLFLEAPRDVGFSYRVDSAPADELYNDDKTAADNVLALKSFFNRFPEYKKRAFYVSGESYGGVYTPTLTNALIQQIQSHEMDYLDLKGLAIGNGEISELQQINSAPQLMYYRDVLGKRELDRLIPCCTKNGVYDNYCNLTEYVRLDKAGNAHAIPSNDPVVNECGKLVEDMAFYKIWDSGNNVYNTYQDCYVPSRHKRSPSGNNGVFMLNDYHFIDQYSRINYMSTDALGGFPCYMDQAAASYLNTAAVRKAIHIPDGYPVWSDCNDHMNEVYVQQHNDTTPVFQSILDSKYPLDILIYNGDADSACNFLGDQWFVDSLALNNAMSSSNRSAWRYTYAKQYKPRIGGYVKRFNHHTTTIDVLTIKGGSHFVPTDRPGPMLQVIYNFVHRQAYSTTCPLSTTLTPLLPPFQPTPTPKVSRMEADKIHQLPGVTFQVAFNQYSGYLKATTGNYLHYWFMESQSNPRTDPVVLWLNGGPGCSSLGGMLTELGPFRPNLDGNTLFEDVFSWNKVASVLFLETPRGVGFSYQDTTVNKDMTYNDTTTALETANALEDFFTVFGVFKSNAFYITGESYAGIYVPTLTVELINRIQKHGLALNLLGFAVGNGAFSVLNEIRANADFMYFRGIYGKDEWDQMVKCCPVDHTSQLPSTVCEYDKYVAVNPHGGFPEPMNTTDAQFNECSKTVVQLSTWQVWHSANDVYNLYQDCYQRSSLSTIRRTREELVSLSKSRRNLKAAYAKAMSSVNRVSTDQLGGFPCYMDSATEQYLNLQQVRDALHVPDYVQKWTNCRSLVEDTYIQEYNDSTPILQKIIDSKYPFRMLIYAGDADSGCNIFESEYTFQDLAKSNGMQSSNRSPWYYRMTAEYNPQIGGYQKAFHKDNLHIDLLTVKGAGHFVPTYRPGPALQMISNFVRNTNDYNMIQPVDTTPKPLLPQYQPPQTEQSTAVPTVPTVPSTSQQSKPSTLEPSTTTTSGAQMTNPWITAILLSILINAY